MKNNLALFVKGILIGLGKIIPGVSGGLIAMSFGVYERLIASISHIYKNFRQNFTFLIFIGSGIILSIILGSNLIMYFLNNYYFATMLLFIGLILGGVPSLITVAKEEKSKLNVIVMLIPFIFIFTVSVLTSGMSINLKLNFFTTIIVGIIDSLTMIIPGISGTAVMMMLGVYDKILLSFSGFNHFNILIPFIIGITLGVFLFSRIIDILIRKYRISCYYAIIGFTISTIFLLLGQTFKVNNSIYEVLIGILFMIIGYLIGKRLN